MPAPFDPIALIQVLASYEVECVLVGGLGAVLHGSPATTNDADIVPERSPENLERLTEALRHLDARLRVATEPGGIGFEPHPALLNSMSVLNLLTRFGDLDLTFFPAGLDDYGALRRASTRFEVDGAAIWVASLDDIIHSKETADRAKDRAVLPLLRALRDELEHDG